VASAPARIGLYIQASITCIHKQLKASSARRARSGGYPWVMYLTFPRKTA
jgi:hypothetical protein